MIAASVMKELAITVKLKNVFLMNTDDVLLNYCVFDVTGEDNLNR